jgi:hypothetical protein
LNIEGTFLTQDAFALNYVQGIRNKHQVGLSVDEVADHNAFFVTGWAGPNHLTF